MKRRTGKILGLGIREIFRCFEDFAIIGMTHGKGGHIYRALFRDTLKKHWRARRRETKELWAYIAYCKRQGYLEDVMEANGTLYYELTERGQQRLARYRISAEGELLQRRTETPTWDGRWRLVIFDIPEKKRRLRDAIRDALRGGNFLMLQQSVFIYPFRCASFVHGIVDYYGLHEHVQLLIADIVENEARVMEHFIESGVLTKKCIRTAEEHRRRRQRAETSQY